VDARGEECQGAGAVVEPQQQPQRRKGNVKEYQKLLCVVFFAPLRLCSEDFDFELETKPCE
jgi:hypothetical protein